MKDKLLIKNAVFWMAMFFIMGAFQSSGEISSNNSEGDTLYVGCGGFECYSDIQSAINDAKSGDTVFVYDDSSPYYENLIIDKSITLIGENRETTIIDGSRYGNVVSVSADGVNISQFTIQNGGKGCSGLTLTDYSDHNIISNNTITLNSWDGVSLFYSSYNTIRDNIISSNSDGIYICRYCNNNNILANTILENNYYGIFIQSSNNDNIFHSNNLIKNSQNADDGGNNIWDNEWNGNYWDDYEKIYPNAKKIWLTGIWNIPYDIPSGSNPDRYPLFKPYVESKESEFNLLPMRLSRIFEQFLTLKQTFPQDGCLLKTFK